MADRISETTAMGTFSAEEYSLPGIALIEEFGHGGLLTRILKSREIKIGNVGLIYLLIKIC